jgi:diguanylate cyclase (GGDEF)-like protein
MTQYHNGARSWDARFGTARRAAIVAFAAIFACIWAESTSHAANLVKTRLPVLTTDHQVHGLTSEQASLGYPVRLRGVVTFWDPYQEGHRALFIADKTGGVFVAPGLGPAPPLHAGSIIEVSGVSDPGGYSPIVSNSKIRILHGSERLPAARPVTLPDLLSGAEDAQWVALRGIVRSVEVDGMHVVLNVATAEGTITATTDNENGTNFRALVDSTILIRGVAAPLVNSRRQMTGERLLFPGMKSVVIEEPAPSDPFSLPVRSLSSLLQYSPAVASPHRIHVRGRVTLSWPGRTVCIVDETAGLCIQTADSKALSEGELVDVVGFLERKDYLPTISAATLKQVKGGVPVSPVKVSAASALEPNQPHIGQSGAAAHTEVAAANAFETDHNCELVRIEGRLVARSQTLSGPTLLLSSGGIVFSAVLPVELEGGDKRLESAWMDGSIISVTGVFVGKVDEQRTIRHEGIARLESFSILLRSPRDVVVVSTPSWWNSQHTLEVLAFVVLTLLTILGWVVILRRQVHRQTEVIRGSEERFRRLAENDGLTGLPVRRVLLERLEMALNEIRRQSNSLALLMIDVDNFKDINDSMGHGAGDRVLCAIGSRLQHSLRPTDIVARMGGDEFTVLLTGLRELREAETIASQLVLTVSEPIMMDGHEVEVSVSIGIAAYPGSGGDVETLLRNSDVALYEAKARGRNCFHMHSAETPALKRNVAHPLTG